MHYNAMYYNEDHKSAGDFCIETAIAMDSWDAVPNQRWSNPDGWYIAALEYYMLALYFFKPEE